MKHILLIVACLLLFLACKKELPTVGDDHYLLTIKQGLKDSLPSSFYHNLNFNGTILNRVDSLGFYMLRVPFKDKSSQQDFVVLQTTIDGKIKRGKIVHLELSVADKSTSGRTVKSVDGFVNLRSLQGQDELSSPIRNGFVSAFHSQVNQRTNVVEAPGMMPEVIITYVRHVDNSYSYSTWCMVQTFFMNSRSNGDNDGGGGGLYGYYSSVDGGGGGGHTGGGGIDIEEGMQVDETILIDVETQDEKPEIDLQKFINCFNNIPDAGANCSIEIFADIPVDKDPNKIFDFGSRSPGHTFINLTKRNGSLSASQNIGFYPRSGIKTISTTSPISSKLVDNGLHEYNCSFRLTLTPSELQTALIQLQRSKNYQYDIDNYNCTDWALDVFNAVGGNLQIPLFDIPGNSPSVGTRMPNGVYLKLQEMKTHNDPRSNDITLGILKGWGGNSTGPCN